MTTTRELLDGLVGAARGVVASAKAFPPKSACDGDCGLTTGAGCLPADLERLRAALAAWERRGRLDQDMGLWERVEDIVCEAMAKPRDNHADFVNAILLVVDENLFGAVPHPGPEQGEGGGRD